jgi:hypothetical protein
MKRSIFSTILFVGLISACYQEPLISPSQAPTPSIQQGVTQSTTEKFEILVYAWDWGMLAHIPPIHIWENHRAIWVKREELNPNQYQWKVFETHLSDHEIQQIHNLLTTSGFWEVKQREVTFSSPSKQIVRVISPESDKSVEVSSVEHETSISTIQEILDNSTLKSEYYPDNAYLFAKRGSPLLDRTFTWSDEEIKFDFSQAIQGVPIEGKTLSTVWKAIQQGRIMIDSQGVYYYYALKIPEISCIINYDKHACDVFMGDAP